MGSAFRRPGVAPNYLEERLEKWDASCNDNNTTLDAVQEVSQKLKSINLITS